MAATATASSAPRYAPEDPTWKGIVDGKTGYLYFWNPIVMALCINISSSVQVEQSSGTQNGRRDGDDDDDRNGRDLWSKEPSEYWRWNDAFPVPKMRQMDLLVVGLVQGPKYLVLKVVSLERLIVNVVR